ncbi:MAG: sensor histidine kinase [Bacteroidaceae bacterium]
MIPAIVICLLAVLTLAILFCRHQNKLKMRAHLIREAVRSKDFTFHLPVKGLFYGERALQEALNDLGQSINSLVARNEVESWQKLTRVLTHEIMNVTTPIQSISQAYLDSPKVKGTSLEKGIHAINEASTHLVTFVDSYRKLTALQEPVLTDIDLSTMVCHTAHIFPHVTCRSDVPQGTVIHTDESLTRQVLVNIIKNAVEAGARTIGFTWKDNQLHVSNDGAPIPAEVRRDIFIPFYTTKTTGSGIGLSLSRQIMTMMGGNLLLAENAHGGYHATFILQFGPDQPS